MSVFFGSVPVFLHFQLLLHTYFTWKYLSQDNFIWWKSGSSALPIHSQRYRLYQTNHYRERAGFVQWLEVSNSQLLILPWSNVLLKPITVNKAFLLHWMPFWCLMLILVQLSLHHMLCFSSWLYISLMAWWQLLQCSLVSPQDIKVEKIWGLKLILYRWGKEFG